jgi:hypothetical protein
VQRRGQALVNNPVCFSQLFQRFNRMVKQPTGVATGRMEKWVINAA